MQLRFELPSKPPLTYLIFAFPHPEQDRQCSRTLFTAWSIGKRSVARRLRLDCPSSGSGCGCGCNQRTQLSSGCGRFKHGYYIIMMLPDPADLLCTPRPTYFSFSGVYNRYLTNTVAFQVDDSVPAGPIQLVTWRSDMIGIQTSGREPLVQPLIRVQSIAPTHILFILQVHICKSPRCWGLNRAIHTSII